MKAKLIFTLWLVVPLLNSIAQKLPSKQDSSVFAPSNIKINGKADEWKGKFYAHNSQTDLFYTLSNDGKNLYLCIQATDPKVISRILNGGITLSINKFGDKKDKEAVSVTYPVLPIGNKVTISFKSQPVIVPGSKESVASADSFMRASNKLMESRSKNIKIAGVKGIDTLISIYNEEGIKAAELFDNKMIYTCETAIPLKYIAVPLNGSEKFTYHLKINATEEHGITRVDSADPMARMRGMQLGNGIQLEQLATDFWGEYTLAKKP